MKKEEIRNFHLKGLKKLGIVTKAVPNAPNLFITYYWHQPRFITGTTVNMRWQDDTEWVEKSTSLKFRKLNSRLKESKYKGMTVQQAIKRAPRYMANFISKSDVIFSREVYEALGFVPTDECKAYHEIDKLQGYEIDDTKFPFGKYVGRGIQWVLENDINYATYLYNKVVIEEEPNKAKQEFFQELSERYREFMLDNSTEFIDIWIKSYNTKLDSGKNILLFKSTKKHLMDAIEEFNNTSLIPIKMTHDEIATYCGMRLFFTNVKIPEEPTLLTNK